MDYKKVLLNTIGAIGDKITDLQLRIRDARRLSAYSNTDLEPHKEKIMEFVDSVAVEIGKNKNQFRKEVGADAESLESRRDEDS